MDWHKFSNRELIDYVYAEIACKKFSQFENVFSDLYQWKQIVDEMQIPVATTYRIGILNMQVMNGGFISYFDNGYGVFAYETLSDLLKIHASKTHLLLMKSLQIVNYNNCTGNDFVDFIDRRKYDEFEGINDQLEKLDDEYYTLADIEDLEKLLGVYLKLNVDKLA